MQVNRRNVLIGLGGLTIGGGALFGTGAFSQVEAERTVDVGTAGDNDALLQLTGNSAITDTESDTGVDLLTISEDSINENALTRFDGAISVENAGTNNVGLSVEIDTDGDADVLDIEHDDSSIVSGTTNLGEGEDPIDLDVVIDTRGSLNGNDLDNISAVTFIADEDDYSPTT